MMFCRKVFMCSRFVGTCLVGTSYLLKAFKFTKGPRGGAVHD